MNEAAEPRKYSNRDEDGNWTFNFSTEMIKPRIRQGNGQSWITLNRTLDRGKEVSGDGTRA